MSANNKKLQLRTPGLRLLAACALAVAVLGLWHGLDVRDGIARTGNRFLYGWYGAAKFNRLCRACIMVSVLPALELPSASQASPPFTTRLWEPRR